MSKHADFKNILYAFYKSNPQLSKNQFFKNLMVLVFPEALYSVS